MLTCSLFITDHWLKRGSLSKQYSANKVRTGVTDDVSKSQILCLLDRVSFDS